MNLPEQDENNAEEFFASKIKEIMEEKGGFAKAVVLKENGEMEEVLYDTTPKNCHVKQFIKGFPTIVGEWADLNVIIVMNRNQENDKLALNKHKLRYPFNDFSCKGNMFLYRFDENCKVVDFTLEEYQSFVNNAQEDIGKEKFKAFEEAQEEEEEDDDEDEEYNPLEDLNDEELSDEFLISIVNKQFYKKFGRLPDDEELKEHVGVVKMKLDLPEDEEDDEDDEEYDPKNDEEADRDDSSEENDDVEEETVDRKEVKELLNGLDDTRRKELEQEIRIGFQKENGYDIDEDYLKSMFDGNDEEEDEVADDNVDDDDDDEEEEEEEDEEKEPVVSKEEYEEAMENVRNLGRAHQVEFVKNLCKRWKNEVGDECQLNDITNTFDYIKTRFANEARNDLEIANELNELELSFMKTLKEQGNINEALFLKAKDVVYQNLKSKALKQWEITHSSDENPSQNDLNELIKHSALQLFDNYEKEEEKQDDNEENQRELELEENNKENEVKLLPATLVETKPVDGSFTDVKIDVPNTDQKQDHDKLNHDNSNDQKALSSTK